MSYSIIIGERKIVEADDSIWYTAQGATDENAPDSGDAGITNERSPGYGQMHEWVESTGLQELFYNKEEGLLHPHPGCRRLLPSHLERVREAMVRLNVTTKDCYEACARIKARTDDDAFDKDGTIYRLAWYEFWMDWALKNCKNPVFYNS